MTHILHIDDSQPYLDLVREILVEAGYQVTSESDAWQGLKLCHGRGRVPYDMIITDLKMDQIDGFSFIKMLRESVSFPPPIIINTSESYNTELTFLAKGLEVVDWIKKPCSNEEILARVDKVFRLNDRLAVRKAPAKEKVLFISRNLDRFTADKTGIVVDESLGGCCLRMRDSDLEVGRHVILRLDNLDFFAKIMWKRSEDDKHLFGFSLIPKKPAGSNSPQAVS